VADPRRVLVVGASGFLGTHIGAALAGDGRAGEMIGVARRVDPGRGDLRSVDLTAPDAPLDALLSAVRPDVVVNAAGRTSGTPDELEALNVAAVERLLAALTRWSPGARLVHLGSAAEYGPSPAGRSTAETDEPRPAGPYGKTKLAATRAVVAAAAGGRDTVVLRVFNPLGAGMDAATLPGTAARRLAAARAAGEGRVNLGPLGAHRDFVAAADVATAVVAAAFGPGAPGEILNVGSGRARPVRDVVRLLAEAAGYTGEVVEADPGSGGSVRSGAVSWSQADISRIAALLGWTPRVPLAEAVTALWHSTPQAAAAP
jgi:nucleoside-diphosphate-sugar epimerase